MKMELRREKLRVINLGLRKFQEDLMSQGVKAVQVDWRPPACGDLQLAEMLDKLEVPEIDKANDEALGRMLSAKPMLVGIGKAKEVIPGMEDNLILHSGPPIQWERMSGPTKGAIIGALIYEGLAKTPDEAQKLAASGEIKYEPCHDHSSVGPMAGIISPSMPVFIIQNQEHGNKAYSNFNEGLGKVLRYGSYDAQVIQRLKWMESELAPILSEALKLSGPIDLRAIAAQALHMGDELHCRNVASSLLVLKLLAPYIVQTDFSNSQKFQALKFMGENPLFALNIVMASSKCTMDAAHNIRYSTLVTVLSRNGTDFGIKVSGLGDRWFTAPAEIPTALFFPGFKEEDANPDIGDSAIMETSGFGSFSSAASPAIVQVVGGSARTAQESTREMSEICLTEDPNFSIPYLDFRGIPRGIDLRKVVAKGIAPLINTGVAHKLPGMGTIGFGLVRAPMSCFIDAMKAFIREYQLG